MKIKILTSILIGFGIISTNAIAQTTASFSSSASLEAKCFLSINNIITGELELITELNKTLIFPSTLDIFCSKEVSYSIAPENPYMGNNGNGFYILRGTGDNKDALSMSLTKGADNSFWLKDTGEIIGIGKAETETYPIYGRIWKSGTPKTLDPSLTNEFNYDVKPDIYSTTVTVNVKY